MRPSDTPAKRERFNGSLVVGYDNVKTMTKFRYIPKEKALDFKGSVALFL